MQYGYDSRMEVLGTRGSVMVGQQPKETYVVATADGRVTRPMNHSWTYLYREAYIRRGPGICGRHRAKRGPARHRA